MNVIKGDRAYNGLRVSGAGTLLFNIPSLQDEDFNNPPSPSPPPFSHQGSAIFRLAWLLGLLEGQNNAASLKTTEVQIADLDIDRDTYYGKVSRKGLLRFICNHLHEIHTDGSRTVIISNVATFIFVFTDNHVVVRCDSRYRSTKQCRFANQDFAEIQRCASGEYRHRESLRTADANQNLTRILNHIPDIGPLSWISTPTDTVLLCRDLDHPECIRFMTAAYRQEIDEMATFANEILVAMDYIAQERADTIQHMTTAFQLFRILRMKRILTQYDLEVAIMAAIGCCVPQPQPSSTSIPDPPIQRTGSLSAFEVQMLDMWTELETVHRGSRSRQVLQDIMVARCDTHLEVVVSQGALALIVKANADMLTDRSITVDDRWLNLLRFTSDNDYLLVG
jgi:hypothetical protein